MAATGPAIWRFPPAFLHETFTELDALDVSDDRKFCARDDAFFAGAPDSCANPASFPACLPHHAKKTKPATHTQLPFLTCRLFAYDAAPAPSTEKAAWDPPEKNEALCESFVVHRVEAPRSLDLSHPFSFDRLENPVSLDSEDCDDDSEASEEKNFALSPRRRLVIKLPVGGPSAKKKRPLALATKLDALDSSIDDMDRAIVGEMVQTPRASCKAPRVDQESPRSVFATAAVVAEAPPVAGNKRQVHTVSQHPVLPPTGLDSRRPDLDNGADTVLRFPAAVEGPLVDDTKHAGTPPLVSLTDRSLDTLRRSVDCDRATRPPGYVGAYSKEARKARVELFLRKRARRVWTKKVKYDVRKNFADSRMRVKGRFVKKEDEDLLRDLVSVV